MNKKNIVTQENIKKIADFLKEACEYFQKDNDGCYHFNLSDKLTLYVGWSYGFNMQDEDLIKSSEGQRTVYDYRGDSWNEGYAVNAAVKVRNDYYCVDFDYLDYPWYSDNGECWNNGITLKPNQTRREYRKNARWFLETFVAMTNAYEKGEIRYQ